MTEDIYARIQKTYTELQQTAREKCREAIEALYREHPQMEALTQDVVQANSDLIKAQLTHAPAERLQVLEAALEDASARRSKYVADNAIDMAVFDPVYACADCRDTGKLADGSRCHCFTEHFARLSFSTEDVSVLDRENFSAFDETVFPEGKQRETMLALKNRLEKYCAAFPDVKNKNITLMGQPGVGKTFLLNCVAKALTDRSFSVIRLSAFKMMNELFSLYLRDNDEFDAVLERLCTVDVLLVDDLGTELRKENFTLNTLYYLIDRRAELQKALILTTNLSPERISELYSERLFSRLINTTNTAAVRLTGSDVRLNSTSNTL